MNTKIQLKIIFPYYTKRNVNVFELKPKYTYNLNYINSRAIKTFSKMYFFLVKINVYADSVPSEELAFHIQVNLRSWTMPCFLFPGHKYIRFPQRPTYCFLESSLYYQFSTYLDSSSSFDLANSRLFLSTCSWGVWARSSWSVMIYLGI